MKVFDILLEGFDLFIRNGDFVIGESTRQHQAILLVANQGELRQYPDRGVGLNGYLLDEMDLGELKQNISRQFELDGMRVNSIDFDGEELKPDAEYGPNS